MRNLCLQPMLLAAVAIVTAALAVPLSAAAQAQQDETFTGKIVRLDRNENTITVETPDGLTIYDVDNESLEIVEVGIFEGTEDPAMRELRLGDLVRITEAVPGSAPERERVVRMERRRFPVMVAEAEPDPVATPRPPIRELPKTASPLPLVAVLGAALMGAAALVRVVRRS